MNAYEEKALNYWSEDAQTSAAGDATATHAAEAKKRHVITEVGGGGSVAGTLNVYKGSTLVDQIRFAAGTSVSRRYTPGVLEAATNEKVEVVADVGATDSAEAFIGGFTIQGAN